MIAPMISMKTGRIRANSTRDCPLTDVRRRDLAVGPSVIVTEGYDTLGSPGTNGAPRMQEFGALRRQPASDGGADCAQDRLDRAAEKLQRNDDDDRNEGEDQGVLREPLALVRSLTRDEPRNHCLDERHARHPSPTPRERVKPSAPIDPRRPTTPSFRAEPAPAGLRRRDGTIVPGPTPVPR